MFLKAVVIKSSLLFCFLVSTLNASLWTNEATNLKDKSLALFETDGKPTAPLKEILILEGLYDPEDSFVKIKEKTQKKWLASLQGQNGLERRDLIDSEEAGSKKEKIAALMAQLGLFEPSLPLFQHYDYALILGSFLPVFLDRIAQLEKLYQEGVRFDQLIFLTGKRLLKEEELQALNNPDLQTEADMIKTLIPSLNPEISKKILIVDAKTINSLRHSTEDTYLTWLANHRPTPGKAIAISSPVFVWLQHLAGKKILPPSFTLDTVSREISIDDIQNSGYFKTALLLDILAKLIYNVDESLLFSECCF